MAACEYAAAGAATTGYDGPPHPVPVLLRGHRSTGACLHHYLLRKLEPCPRGKALAGEDAR